MILQNGESLAYLGDAIYELHIRKHLVNSGITNVNKLHKSAILHTSAKKQAFALRKMMDNNVLTEREIDIYKHGRNAVHASRKKIDIATYSTASGFEALLGHLYLENDSNRLEEIMNLAIMYSKEVPV